ncbi:BIG/ATPase V1 complex, subunit S1 [Usnea florida]
MVCLGNAFKNTSPFFLFSTSELLASSSDLTSAETLSKVIIPELETCISDTYIIVSQPGANALDYRDRASPYLQMKMLGRDKSIRSSLAVSEVLGELSAGYLSGVIQEKCGAGHLRVDASTGSFAISEDSKPRVINLDFPPLPAGDGRYQKLLENDAFLASFLDLISSNKFTVVYTTTPPDAAYHPALTESESYEMDAQFQAPVHMELKRDLSNTKRASGDDITLPKGPLFERYQFLSPGLFMGLLVFFILLSILYVGINGVASLQVSYAAFDKEMGPAAQKKQSQ